MQIDPDIFKAYDIRGIWEQNINTELAYLIGIAYAEYVKPRGEVLVGEDVRLHSHELKTSLINGLRDSGIDVVDVGLISTDMYYFGVGYLQTDGGIQVTASHNPPEWHGFKMVKKGPVAMTLEDGIGQIRDLIIKNKLPKNKRKGKYRKLNLTQNFIEYILNWISDTEIKPLTIVINPNFGIAGKIFSQIIEQGKLPIKLIPINAEPDGSFPKGRPDPYIPENRKELCQLVKSSHANLGITWDADADRVFFVDELGNFIDPYYLNTLLIKSMLTKSPGSAIVYEPRYQWATIETILTNGGKPIACQVGHSYIKQKLRNVNGVFASESSGHTYYQDFWYADCGMIPPMQILEMISGTKKTLSQMLSPIMNKYFISGEINSEINDKEKKLQQIAHAYSDGKISTLDGIAVEYDSWRFCVRPSNTEPLLRLTLEAKDESTMVIKKNELLKLIRS